MRIWGVATDPAHKIASFFTETVHLSVAAGAGASSAAGIRVTSTYSTAVALLFKRILLTQQSVATVRFSRVWTEGVKYAVAAELRWPLAPTNPGNREVPSVPFGVLKSLSVRCQIECPLQYDYLTLYIGSQLFHWLQSRLRTGPTLRIKLRSLYSRKASYIERSITRLRWTVPASQFDINVRVSALRCSQSMRGIRSFRIFSGGLFGNLGRCEGYWRTEVLGL